MSSETSPETAEKLVFGSPAFEARMAETFRYAQVGRCANGVAHDLNNYLGAVMAYAELIGLEHNLSEDARRMLGEVHEGVRKASHTLGIFTGHARKDVTRITLVNPVRLLEHVVELQTYNARASRITVEFEGNRDMPTLLGDAPKLEQAFNALFVNAMEALTDLPERTLSVHADRSDVEAVVVFKDTGPPIPESLRTLIFEPYFTTKEGPHMGLGLPTACRILAMHQGTLTYAPDTGFTVRLPVDNGLKLK